MKKQTNKRSKDRTAEEIDSHMKRQGKKLTRQDELMLDLKSDRFGVALSMGPLIF